MFEKESPPTEFQISLNMRQMSFVVAILLAFCFFVFIAGYFLGKKRSAEEFLYRADQDSLADQIYSSMCVLYDAKDENEDSMENAGEAENNDLIESSVKEEVVALQPAKQEQGISGKHYRATIAGFSASNVADGKNLVAHLTHNGYPCELTERSSRTSKGKIVVWYQVVTKPYASHEALDQAKPKIAHLAHVKEKSISINECA